VAPGTWGSLPAAVLFAVMVWLEAPAGLVFGAMAALVLAGAVLCVVCAPAVIELTGRKDPPLVVLDELAGQALTFIFVAFAARQHFLTLTILGFGLFRFFDIVKPPPERALEKLPAGWGVLADDLMAAVYAGVLLLVASKTGIVQYLATTEALHSGSPSILEACILGAVQGLTEFLPVSSSGHLVLLETAFGVGPETTGMVLFDLAVHAATVLAIFVVFRRSLGRFLRGIAAAGGYGRLPADETGRPAPANPAGGQQKLYARAVKIYKKSPSVHLLILAIFATMITGACGFWLESYFAAARSNLGLVAVMWVVTGTLLLSADRRKRTRLGLRQFALWQAGLIGLAQGIAVMPGISRSGATICAAILLGLRRRWAVEFSFLLAVPAILGAGAVKLAEDFSNIGAVGLSAKAVAAGFVTAAATGIVALKILVAATRRARLKIFAWYCYGLAVCVVVCWLLGSRF